MNTYIAVRKSQAHLYFKTPLYIKNSSADYVLYKGENERIDAARFAAEQFPQLFTPARMHDFAQKELYSRLNEGLVTRIRKGDLKAAKQILCTIVQEAMGDLREDNFDRFPETIEIMYSEYAGTGTVLKNFIDIHYGGSSLVEHSVNVMVLTLNYCLFCDFSESDVKRLSLAALLHDVGLTRLPQKILEIERKLTDEEFEVFKTHALIGHNIVKDNMQTDAAVAIGIHEHHERLDGGGYPRGNSDISFDGRLIGLIDSFESLINSEKIHRQKREPFDALKKIQDEVLAEGKFDKKIYRDLCLSLSGKQV